MFFDIFRIRTPSWYLAFLDGKRLTRESFVFRRSRTTPFLTMLLFFSMQSTPSTAKECRLTMDRTETRA